MDHDSADSRDSSAAGTAPGCPAAPTARPDRARSASCTDSPGWTSSPGCGTSSDPQTQAYLRDERAYYDARTAHTRSLQRTMFDEMSRRTLPADRSVSWTRGGLVYYTWTVAGKEYQQFWRSVRARFFGRPAPGRERSRRGVGLLLARAARAEPGRDRCSPTRSTWRATRSTSCGSVTCATGKDLPDTVARTLLRAGPGRRTAAPSSTSCTTRRTGRYQVWRHELGTDPGDGRPGPAGGRRAVRAGRARRSGRAAYVVVILAAPRTPPRSGWCRPPTRGAQPPRGPGAHARGPVLGRARAGAGPRRAARRHQRRRDRVPARPRPGRRPRTARTGRTWSARTRRSAC